jgi:hypothetical protein
VRGERRNEEGRNGILQTSRSTVSKAGVPLQIVSKSSRGRNCSSNGVEERETFVFIISHLSERARFPIASLRLLNSCDCKTTATTASRRWLQHAEWLFKDQSIASSQTVLSIFGGLVNTFESLQLFLFWRLQRPY